MTMKLYFFRHGLAEEGVDMEDAKRALTKEGQERTKAAAKALESLDVRPTWLYSSPLVRAYQTADILAPALKQKVTIREELAPGFGVAQVEAIIQALGDDDDVMFVGHEPDFSTIVGKLTGGSVMMKKGGLARVDVVSRQPLLGTLVWLLPPKVLSAVKE